MGFIIVKDKKVEFLANAKSYLEKRIRELQEEISLLENLLRIVDEMLSQKSFVTATQLSIEKKKTGEAETRRAEIEKLGKKIFEINIMSRTGEILAILEAYENAAIIKPLMEFRITTPPFKAFLVNRILEGFKKKDEDRVLKGEITENEVFRYEIISEDDMLKEIRIYNYRSRERLYELRGAVRWTLNRMLEKQLPS